MKYLKHFESVNIPTEDDINDISDLFQSSADDYNLQKFEDPIEGLRVGIMHELNAYSIVQKSDFIMVTILMDRNYILKKTRGFLLPSQISEFKRGDNFDIEYSLFSDFVERVI